MQTVLIVLHLMIVVALVAVVLLQRSEGGALGVGGGSGFMTGRGQANILTRATAILGTLFFITSLGLTLLANYGGGNKSVLEGVLPAPGQPASAGPAEGKGTVLDQLRRIEDQRANTAPAQAAPGSASRPTATPAAPPSAAGTATPVSKAAPVEPTGMPDVPAARAPSAPVQESPVPRAPAPPPGRSP